MTSRTGPLSDIHILEHCKRYRPIPLGAAQHILMKDLKPQHEHAFGSKPLKYHTIMTRPKDFDTLAKAITKMSGNPMVREELNSLYAKDLQSVPQAKPVLRKNLPPNRGPVIPRSLLAAGYDSNGNGSNGNGSNFSGLSDNDLDEIASNFTYETPHFTSPTRPQDNADLSSNPFTTRRMVIEEEYASNEEYDSSDVEEYDMAQLPLGYPRHGYSQVPGTSFENELQIQMASAAASLRAIEQNSTNQNDPKYISTPPAQ